MENLIKEKEQQTEMCPYAYFLDQVPGLGSKTNHKMVAYFGTPKEAYFASERELKALLGERKTMQFLHQKEKWQLQEEVDKIRNQGIKFVHLFQSTYPGRLQKIPDPPFVLYYKGELPDENIKTVAVVGARDCSPYGKHVAAELGKELAAAGIQVISGMARGVDGICQKETLLQGGKSFGILGCGVDICYPREHQGLYLQLQKQGGVLSTYVPGTVPRPELFPPRNRIISGLADALVVVEAREKSGTFITVDMALEQGKEVFCVPGRVTDPLSYGCNQLIAQGAQMLLSCQDLVERRNKKELTEDCGLSMEAAALLGCLDFAPKSLETLQEELKKVTKVGEIPLSKVMELLWELVLLGKAEPISGSYYAKKEN